MGDFNFPGIKWIENCGFVNSQNSTEAMFCEALVDHCFFQLNTLTTHFSAQRSNVLDLVITNAPQCIKDIDTISPDEDGLSTDHHLLEFDILGHHRRIKKPERYVYKFKGVDLESMKNDFKQSSRITESLSGSDVNNCWLKWKSAVLDITDSHIPKIKLKNANTPPWILHLLKKKETSRRAAKRLNSEHHREKFRELRRASKKLINKKVKEYNESLGESVKENPKRFWSHFRHKTKSNSIPASVTFNGTTYCSAIDKAEAFDSFFYSTFTNDSGSVSQLDPPAPRMNVPLLDNVYLTEKMIFEVLTKLDPHKAPGSDGLPTYVLKLKNVLWN